MLPALSTSPSVSIWSLKRTARTFPVTSSGVRRTRSAWPSTKSGMRRAKHPCKIVHRYSFQRTAGAGAIEIAGRAEQALPSISMYPPLHQSFVRGNGVHPAQFPDLLPLSFDHHIQLTLWMFDKGLPSYSISDASKNTQRGQKIYKGLGPTLAKFCFSVCLGHAPLLHRPKLRCRGYRHIAAPYAQIVLTRLAAHSFLSLLASCIISGLP